MNAQSARWTRARVSINTGEIDDPSGWERVSWTGYRSAAAPGLAVTKEYGGRARWAITHIESGFQMPILFGSLPEARKVAVLLAELADWRMTAAQIMDDPELKYAAEAILEPFR